MITAEQARENMNNSLKEHLETISDEISKLSSENKNSLVVSVPPQISRAVKMEILEHGFKISIENYAHSHTFEIHW